ncbi:hypothetical protein CHLNCDRAFT_142698 [Chlorella variabilis]|uniref:peptidylprolyl isomerase n=1 Tax=Chlorella variabilis TaxID=554065 RepID=E1Z8I2_CHLVA|nr:hypothetical protein CHLNCDRAFT_142698 [Chlorella variabilis]EFN57340.1 hypothetical protein CHLNCDRAFT_142698 [Chlorella variabilis]|eukprot:XP_005849442.1 hypothetical protein CHLNCDRAFT_142698 [Chlorella variabilis]
MAGAGLAAYLQKLRVGLQEPTSVDPDVDDKELGVDDAAKFREEEDMKGGAVLKGTVEPGEGEATPQEGDLVFLHYSLLDEHRQVLRSTLHEHGGSGRPQPFVVGRGRRMLRGMELGVLEMRRGERAMLNIKPDYAFLHKDSGLPLPQGLRREAPVVADVTLTSWYPGSSVKCVGPASDVFLRTLRPGQGWESPRLPFDVSLHINARTGSTTGRQDEGDSYFSSTNGEPLACPLGAGQLPPGVETALSAMQRQQEAVAYCPTSQLYGSKLLPDPPDVADGTAPATAQSYAEIKLHLLDFSQVRDMTGDGAVVKRIVRKGEGEFPMDCPLEDSRVRVHYRVKAQGEEQWSLDSREDGQAAPLEFDTGMGEVPESGCSMEFEVELIDFEKEPTQHALSGADKLKHAARLKEQGNMLFKQGKTKLARQKYQKALKMVGGALELDSEEDFAAASATKAACLLNLARCAEREQEWGEALGWCTKAINEDDSYAKAYFRRAVVAACLGEYESARGDLAICAELDESTAEECEQELQRMERQEQAAEAKTRDALKGFFNR